ncbi:MAG TPA: M20/M25/M40 family metallo-hydrolase [Gemmatimonadaceae bacterium]|nr:M20/M25/M40 family metallo-hydrolase [Gemmatimonadaceae bacterium]
MPSPRSLRRAAALALVAAGTRAAAAQAPDTEIYLAPLTLSGGVLQVGTPVDVTNRPGYDNQPAFTRDGTAILYTSQRGAQTDIFRYDLATRRTTQVTNTPESEYSPVVTPDGRYVSVVRVEADSTQRLWRFPLSGRGEPFLLLPGVQPVGYYAWADARTIALFVLGADGAPNTLQVARFDATKTDTVMTGIGRSLHRVPGTSHVSFLHAAAAPRVIDSVDPATQAVHRVVQPLEGSEDFAWVNASLLVMARDGKLFQHAAGGDDPWREVADLGVGGRVTRLAVSPDGDWLAFVAEMPARPAPSPAAVPPGPAGGSDTTVVRETDVRRLLGALADDSLQGRRTATPGSEKAARLIAEEFRRIGLQPAGDSGGYLQRVPLAMGTGRRGRPGLVLLPSWTAWDSVPGPDRRLGANVLGVIPGSDPTLRDQVVLVDAHYDHLGMDAGRAVNGDSIFNGADDDASGVVAVIEIARALMAGPPPKRTVVFAATTGEEVGLLGTRWYIEHPAYPLDAMVANLEIEMIGRPDSLAGGAGKAWLTGYERSTMGDALAAAGVPIVADPRPDQRFFERSDNIAFARAGIPAHTLSTFNLHADYHTVDDEVERVDFPHMTRVIQAAVRAVRLLTDGPKPEWKPGGRP